LTGPKKTKKAKIGNKKFEKKDQILIRVTIGRVVAKMATK
jgi:hypothetical protein